MDLCKGKEEMRQLIYIISAVLLLVSCSGVKVSGTNMGSCSDGDFNDCKVKAEQGFAEAQTNLGKMYYLGKGVLQDYKKAFEWRSKAATQGDATAQNNLGIMYANGEGVLQDYVMAHMFWNIAGANGNRDKVAKVMAPSQIVRAQRLAREWMEKHPR